MEYILLKDQEQTPSFHFTNLNKQTEWLSANKLNTLKQKKYLKSTCVSYEFEWNLSSLHAVLPCDMLNKMN